MTDHPRDTGNTPAAETADPPGDAAAQHSEPERSPHESPEPVSEEDYWSQYPDTLTTADVAKIIRTGAPAVRARLRDGTIPGHRTAHSWIISTAAILPWPTATRNPPPPHPPA